jgi:hypothetical protein
VVVLGAPEPKERLEVHVRMFAGRCATLRRMCRALVVLCVAEDEGSLAALKRAAVSADWELAPGATTGEAGLAQLHEVRPHVLVVFGAFDRLVATALDAYPSMRVVADRDLPGASVVVDTMDGVRDAVRGRRPGGPVR